MTRSPLSMIALAFAASSSVGMSAACADVTDTKVPLNYNFHGMVQPTDWDPDDVLNPANADRPNAYRSIERRGMIWAPTSVNSIGYYSTTFGGRTSGIPYAFFDTLGYSATPNPTQSATWGLDIVHLGNRCVADALDIPAYDNDPNTPIGNAPAWSVCDHTGLQTTTLASPITVNADTKIGLLAQRAANQSQAGSFSGFDVVLGFANGYPPVTVHCSAQTWTTLNSFATSWFNQPYKAYMASRFVGTSSRGTWQADGFDPIAGSLHYDAPIYTEYAAGSAPDLLLMEYVIDFSLIVAGMNNPAAAGVEAELPPAPGIVGQQLTSISFSIRPEDPAHPLYPFKNTQSAVQVLAATVRHGTPAANYSCASAVAISSGLTFGSTGGVPVDPACTFVPAVSNPPLTVPAHYESPLTPCSGTGTNRSDNFALWYKYTPSASATVTVDTLSSANAYSDPIVTVFTTTSTCANTYVVCNDNSASPVSVQSKATWSATAGTTYFIRVSGRLLSYVSFVLNITGPAAQPTNVLCCRGTTCQSIPAVGCTGTFAGSLASVVGACTGNTVAGCCFGDYDHQNGKSIDDIFIYLNAWFATSPYADISGNGAAAPTIDDIFIFLNAWFGTCT